jgi:capsular exopolysaccharide synthesis family protein
LNYNENTLARNESTAAPEKALFGHQSTSAYGLRNLLRVLTKRRKWIAGTVIACMIASLVFTWMMKPVYQSTATIELNKNSSGSLSLGLGDVLGQQYSSNADLTTDLQTETAILKSDSLALAVIQRLHLEAYAPFNFKPAKDSEAGLPLELAPLRRTGLLALFRRRLIVQIVPSTRLIKVSFESGDSKQAALIANALIDCYKNQYLQSHYNATSEASDWLTRQLSELKANVEDSEKKLTDFERASGILSLQTSSGNSDSMNGPEIHSVVIQKLDALNSELTQAEANTIEKEAIYRLVSNGSKETILGLAQDPLAGDGRSLVLTSGGGISSLQQLSQQRDQTELALAQATTTLGPNNRHLKELSAQLQYIDGQIHDETLKIVKRANDDYRLAKQTEDVLRGRLGEQQAAASKLNETAVEFAVLSQEASSRKKLYDDLYTKLQEANVSAGIKATNITVVDSARAQVVPVRPNRIDNLGMGLLVGIILGLLTAFIVDTLDNTVVSAIEAEEITGFPVIGVIPSFNPFSSQHVYGYGYGRAVSRAYGAIRAKEKRNPAEEEREPSGSVWILRHPESAVAEAVRSLRTSILLSRAEGPARVLLITSCVPGEGKSTVSANLAVSFAQYGKKVVIVEADMRRPTMKHVLDVPNEKGLSTILAGSCTLEEATIRGVAIETLDVIPAGPRPPLPSEILGSAAFDRLLEQLRSIYDLVIIDSPPALVITDAIAIASKADAVLWVARASVVTRPQLYRVAQMIERNDIPLIGLVLNRVNAGMDPYGYGYGYDYDQYDSYSGYGYGEEKSDD